MNSSLPLLPPQKALEALLTLRNYYAPLVSEYEKLYTQARENLTHVEALLANWPSNHEVANEESAPDKQENSLLFFGDKGVDDDFEDIPLLGLSDEDSVSNFSDGATEDESREPLTFSLIQQELDDELDAVAPTDDQALPLQFPLIETASTKEQQSLLGVEIPMLPQYQSLSRREAIEQVLAEQIGTVVHIDFIVRSLYGELQPEVFKVVKSRVQSALTHGKDTNKWFSVPGAPGHFTLSLTLLPKNQTKNSSPQVKRNKPNLPPPTKEIPMLKAYQGQFLIDALSTFLEQNAGQVFGIAEIITGIYGQLSATDVREVKNKVLNELSRGHRTLRFFRVPSQIGFYTWDLSLINNNA